MYNDCWVASSSWTIIDYCLRKRPSYYAVKRTYSPEMLSFAEDADGLSLWLVNDHIHPVEGALEYGWGRFADQDYQVLGRGSFLVPPNRSHRMLALPAPKLSGEERAERYYWARWLRHNEVISRHYWWPARWGDVSLPDAGLSWDVERGEDGDHAVKVSAKRYAWMVCLDAGDGLDFEDNYFDLLPGESRIIRVAGPAEELERLTAVSSNRLLNR
jgi:beta-mannosidase